MVLTDIMQDMKLVLRKMFGILQKILKITFLMITIKCQIVKEIVVVEVKY